MMRAMLLEFPDDPTCAYLDRQYMLGGSLLVAPVFGADEEATPFCVACGQFASGSKFMKKMREGGSTRLTVTVRARDGRIVEVTEWANPGGDPPWLLTVKGWVRGSSP